MYKKGIISVIVPVYNVEKYLRQCLDSIINQTYRNLDIILVDDGSTDKSGAICDEYAEKDSRIRVIHKENGGLSSARNAGLDLIEKNGGGEFLAYVDSDDFLELDIYEKCIDKFCKFESTDLVIFGFKLLYAEGIIETKSYPSFDNLESNIVLREYEAGEMWNGINPGVWDKVYRTKNILNLRFPDGRVYEDSVYIYQVLAKVSNVSIMSDLGYNYRRDNVDSISNSIKNNIVDVFINLEGLRDKYILDKNTELVAGINTFLITQLRIYNNKAKKLPIYKNYLKAIKRTRKYPIRLKSKSNYYIRYRLFSYIPRYSYMIESLVDKMYNLIVPKLKQIYKK